MEFLRTRQLTIMLFFSGTCGVLAILALMIRSLPARRKKILSVFEASVMMLLLSDRYAYLFRGNTSRLGWRMVRISNFFVFFLAFRPLCFYGVPDRPLCKRGRAG